MVYVASSVPLPTGSWEPDHPPFHAEPLIAVDEPVRKKFAKPHVYRLGAHEGCGCGFQHGEFPGLEDAEDVEKARVSRGLLVEFLKNALREQDSVELFACWDGDQGEEPEHRGRVSPEDLLVDRTFFREKEFLVVARPPGSPLGRSLLGSWKRLFG